MVESGIVDFGFGWGLGFRVWLEVHGGVFIWISTSRLPTWYGAEAERRCRVKGIGFRV